LKKQESAKPSIKQNPVVNQAPTAQSKKRTLFDDEDEGDFRPVKKQ
jgi:hypothetical protein